MAELGIADVPGRQRDLDELLRLAAAMARTGRSGHVAFVAGGAGSGRRLLLRALVQELGTGRERPVVLAGGFVEGRYEAWDDDPGAVADVVATLRRLGDAGERIAGWLADAGLPFARLLAQALALGALPLETLEQLVRREQPDLLDLTPRVLRRLCERGPVACVVDDADAAANGGLWADLVLGLGQRIACDLPLLLVLGVDGPPELGEHDDDEPDSLNVARQLTADGIATWHPLAPIDAEALRAWTGPVQYDVATTLLAITGGEPTWTAGLWREWRRRGIVEDVTEARWRFAPEHERLLDEVDDLLRERMLRQIGDRIDALREARQLLACAALEGRRFTPAAVADVLQRDADDAIDLLDALICDDEHPDGLVVDDGWIPVEDEAGRRHVARYSFARELDWMTLRHYGLPEAERGARSGALADAVAARLGREAHRVAQPLARLYAAAQRPDRAQHFRRMADKGVRGDVVLWRARRALAEPTPAARAERLRAARLLLAAAYELYSSGPFDEGLAFAQAAERLSPLPSLHAHAVRVSGVHHKHLGHTEEARRCFQRAAELQHGLGSLRGEASARNSLAVLDLGVGNYETARQEFERLRELWQQLGESAMVVSAEHHLARVDVYQGRREEARAKLVRVVKRFHELGVRRDEAIARSHLAELLLRDGEHERAAAELNWSLEIMRELHDTSSEATTLARLAGVAMAVKDEGRAVMLLEQARDSYRAMSNHVGEATVRYTLARLAFARGEASEARRELDELLRLAREQSDPTREAAVHKAIADLDLSEGETERAEAGFSAAAEIWSGLAVLDYEADVRVVIARLQLEAGAGQRARTQLERVIELRHELGDHDREHHARAMLAAIDD